MKLIKEELINIPDNPGIYLFTNTVNNKHYVGQAIKLKKRLLSHLGNYLHCRYDNPLYRAITKYGINSFEITILKEIKINLTAEVLTKVLDKLEIYYIKTYDSYGKNGYNQTQGGDGGILGYKMTDAQKEVIGKNSKTVACDGRYFIYCKNLETNEITSDVNMAELALKLKLNIISVRTAKCKKRLYKGKYIFANTLEEINEIEQNIKIENYSSRYDPTISHDDLYIEYYEYIMTLDNPTIPQVAANLGLSIDTINKRNKKLRNLGYKLPFKTKRKISKITITNVLTNDIISVDLKSMAEKFGISEDSARDQIKYCENHGNLYKRTYKLEAQYA